MNLPDLSLPFPADDIEWRVSQAGRKSSGGGIWCKCVAYITARAIQHRLDDVCKPENWRNEQPVMLPTTDVKNAFACGISIRVDDEWITKWDVSDPTQIEGTKGGFSGAMKRAGAQWGIGRYLYNLTESFAEAQEESCKGWNYAVLKKDSGTYYWKPPELPAWALPREKEYEISAKELADLKGEWRKKFLPNCQNPKDLLDGFKLFVNSCECGEFPVSDVSCWLRVNWDKCRTRIKETVDPEGPDSDVPFTGEGE